MWGCFGQRGEGNELVYMTDEEQVRKVMRVCVWGGGTK